MGWLAETFQPAIITNIFKQNKTLVIALIIIGFIILLLKWFRMANEKLRGI